jgi:hypothetical protein
MRFVWLNGNVITDVVRMGTSETTVLNRKYSISRGLLG